MIIKSGPADVLATGTVIGYYNNPIEFIFPSENEDDMRLIIEFRNDEIREELYSENEVINSHTMKMTLYNFNSPMGSGSRNPIRLGNFNNKVMFGHFRISTVNDDSGENDKMLHYTFYLVDEGGEVNAR